MYLVLPTIAAASADSHAKEVDELQETEARDSHEEAADTTAIGNQGRHPEQNSAFYGSKLMFLEVNREPRSDGTEGNENINTEAYFI